MSVDQPAFLTEEEWQSRRESHETRVSPWIAPRLARSSRGERHPVDDFLFDYYSYRPGQLRRWHPGAGTLLGGQAAKEFLTSPHYARFDGHVAVSPAALKPQRLQFIRWLLDLLEAVRERPAFFGCAGLHEWAMVYRSNEMRHPRWPLRLGAAGTAAVVESLPIRCSHYDAFRFFTIPARPLNAVQPKRSDAMHLEQGGCLHANMDLYKWAYKLAPYSPSELVAETFSLAREIRQIDMRASPYDFSAIDLAPIAIETPEGRAAYEGHQRTFSRRAAPLREQIVVLCRSILDSVKASGSAPRKL